MSTYSVGYLIGSLARDSINRKLAVALTRLAPPEIEMREIVIADLPPYSYDYDANYPPVARAFKDAIAAEANRGSNCLTSSHVAVPWASPWRF